MDQLEILDLRQYSSADLRPLLERESVLWAEALHWDYHSSVEMILRYVDSRILPGCVAIENGKLAGYAFYVFEGAKGVIGDLYVDPEICGGTARADRVRFELLEHVIRVVKETPGVKRIESQLLSLQSGDVAVPFLNGGFTSHRRIFFELLLSGIKTTPINGNSHTNGHTHGNNGPSNGNGQKKISGIFPAAELLQGLTLRRWQETDFQAAASLINQCYAGHIDSQINDQYRSHAGAMRFLNNIVRFPGCGVFDPNSSLVATEPGGALAGLLLCSRVRNDVGHITQVCLLPQWRNRKLGKMLIEQCAQELARRGFTSLTLTVTEANENAVKLYKMMGFHMRRVFDAYVWEQL